MRRYRSIREGQYCIWPEWNGLYQLTGNLTTMKIRSTIGPISIQRRFRSVETRPGVSALVRVWEIVYDSRLETYVVEVWEQLIASMT